MLRRGKLSLETISISSFLGINCSIAIPYRPLLSLEEHALLFDRVSSLPFSLFFSSLSFLSFLLPPSLLTIPFTLLRTLKPDGTGSTTNANYKKRNGRLLRAEIHTAVTVLTFNILYNVAAINIS